MIYGLDEASQAAEEHVTKNPTKSEDNEALRKFFDGIKPDPRKKLKELDYAIAQIAFNKRQRELSCYFWGREINSPDYDMYFKRIEELQKVRQTAKK